MKSICFDGKFSKGKPGKTSGPDESEAFGLLGFILLAAIIYWLAGASARNNGDTIFVSENKLSPPPSTPHAGRHDRERRNEEVQR